MQKKELKLSVQKLVKDKGCIFITSLLRELDLLENDKHGEVYEIIYDMVGQGKITLVGGIGGYIRHLDIYYQ